MKGATNGRRCRRRPGPRILWSPRWLSARADTWTLRDRVRFEDRRPGIMKSDYRWVSDPDSLTDLAECLGEAPRHALDTESNSSFAYDERICLLQFNVGGELWVIDPLALPDGARALDAIRGPLESPDVVTFVHGGEFDVACLKRDYGIALRGLWDSQKTASYLGWRKTGYGALVEKICGVALPKAYSRHNWGIRPLEPGPLRYALHDVVYLPEVCDQLAEEVRAADIEEEIHIAHRSVEAVTWNGGHRPEGLWRIKGAGSLEPAALSILMAVFEWRDGIARKLDLPPGMVVNNQAMLALARNPPRRLDALRRLGLRGDVKSRYGADLLRLVREARQDPPELPPRSPRGERDPVARRRSEKLKTWRRKEAERRGVSAQVVLPTPAMLHLVQQGADDLEGVPQLGAKRIRFYGETLERLCS